MISRLLTTDLLLSAITRYTGRLPKEQRSAAVYELFQGFLELLNGWAQLIESSGTAVSLETIATNAFQIWERDEQSGSLDGLKALGADLVETAIGIDQLLNAGRVAENATLSQAKDSQRLKAALEDRLECVTFHQAALIITGQTNSTQAFDPAFKFLAWISARPNLVGDQVSAWLRNELSLQGEAKRMKGKRTPRFPKELARELSKLYRVYGEVP
jgi:hypothetical protein